jgi:hypothetical protein
MTARKLSPRHEPGQVILHNRLPPEHPRRLGLETAIRSALAGLPGRWDVVLEGQSRLSLVVAVVAPDGSAITVSCCNPEQRDPASIAETVRAACSRRRWLEPAKTLRANAGAGPESPGTPASGQEQC